MKLSAALQYENQPRSEADWNKIYLNHDGKFFHAYEWSAWLIKAVACTEEYQQQRGDAKILQTMLYTTKNSEYIITGFPLDSIGKYIPQYVSMNPVEDGGGDLIIEIELPQEWDGVDASKLMANAPADCGMPIGNLTSQLFSNVYMNPFDQMVKRLLYFLHYGRYVDDSDTICSDRHRLTDAIPVMRDFLKDELCLDMHMGKTQIVDVRYGVEFLGAFIKPYRTYICNRSLSRIRQEAADVMHMGRGQAFRTVNSLLGVMSHYSSYNLRREIFTQQHILRYGSFDRDMTTFTLGKPVTAMCA